MRSSSRAWPPRARVRSPMSLVRGRLTDLPRGVLVKKVRFLHFRRRVTKPYNHRSLGWGPKDGSRGVCWGLSLLRQDERGASAVEFAIISGILFMLVFGAIQFGWAYYRWQGLQSSAREGARVAAIGGTQSDAATRARQSQNGFATSDIQINMAYSTRRAVASRSSSTGRRRSATTAPETRARILWRRPRAPPPVSGTSCALRQPFRPARASTRSSSRCGGMRTSRIHPKEFSDARSPDERAQKDPSAP